MPFLPFPRCRPFTAASSSLTSVSIPFKTPSTIFCISIPPPNTLFSTAFASSSRPTFTSHLGVSGMKSITKHCTAAGTAPSPTIHLHPVSSFPYSTNAQPTIYATTCPNVTNKILTVISRPLKGAGANSAMYKGATKLPAPTARPTIERPAIITGTGAPRMNAASARRTTRLRPSASASTPERGEMRSANRAVADVIRDLSRVLNG
jgi:hypothetical protein